MDDKTFQACIIETQVMLTRDHVKWNYDTLLDLVEGPLLSAKRMEEEFREERRARAKVLQEKADEDRRREEQTSSSSSGKTAVERKEVCVDVGSIS